MKKDQREVLTQEFLRKELTFHHKAEGISLIGFAVAMGALCLFLSIFFLVLELYWVLAIFDGVFLLLMGFLGINYLINKKLFETCEFIPEKDVVEELAEEARVTGVGKNRRYSIDYVIRFRENGKKVTSKDEYDRTSVGDVFYVVKAKTKKSTKTVATYSARAYRSPEDEGVGLDDGED